MLNNSSKILKKLIIIFLIITLIYSNFVLIGNSMVKGLFSYALDEVEVPIQDKIVAEQNLITNKVCEINGELKRIIQVELTTGIEEDYPIKETTLTLNTGIVSEKLEDVKVTGLNQNSYTVATVELKEENKLKINLINKAETLESKEKGLDKFLVTYVYEYVERKEVQDEVLENGIIISSEDKDTENTIQKPLEKLELRTYKDKQVVLKSFAPATFENIEETTNELGILNIENRDIHKTTIKEGAVEYTEKLNLDLSYRNDKTNIIIEDKLNEFYNNDDIVNNEANLKYTKTIINKDTLLNLLDKDAKLTITDLETGKIITELTKQNIEEAELGLKVEQKYEEVLSDLEVEEPSQEIIIENENVEIPSQIVIETEYEEENIVENTIIENAVVEKKVEEPKEKIYETRACVTVTEKTVEIEYVTEVRNIQIKMENIIAQSSTKIEPSNFVVENTKSIYNVQNVDDLKYLNEEVKYILGQEEKVVESKITFKDKVTRAKIEADKTELKISEDNKVNYTITLDTETENSELFVNPIFLIELPESVSAINRENSQFSVKNDNGAFTKKNVFISSLLGKQYVVMMFEGEQTEENIINGNTIINLSLELNISEDASKGNQETILYYINDTVTSYEDGKTMGNQNLECLLITNAKEELEDEEIQDNIINEDSTESNDIYTYMSVSTGDVVKQGDRIEYVIYVYNYDEEIKKLQIKDVIPEGIELEDVVELVKSEEYGEYDKEQEIQYNYDNESRVLSINIDKILPMKQKTSQNEDTTINYIEEGIKVIKIVAIVETLESNSYSTIIKNKANILFDEKTIETNEIITTVSDSFLTIEHKQLSENTQSKDEVIFEVKISNNGLVDATGVQYFFNAPKGIILRSAECGFYDESENRAESTIINNYYEINSITIPAEKTLYLRINGYVENLDTNNVKVIKFEDMVNNSKFKWEVKLDNRFNFIESINSQEGGC